jgi:hypothetical protein
LHVHLGQSEFERTLRARAALERGGVEAALSHLRNLEFESADSGRECLGFEAVGVAAPLGAALVGRRAQVALALDEHRGIDEDAKCVGEAVQARLSQ